MISLTTDIPKVYCDSAEHIKLRCCFEAYGDDALFWRQDNSLISMIDGNMIIFNSGAEMEELKEFVDIMSPACVFSDIDTLKAINRIPSEEICVMGINAEDMSDTDSDKLSSKELYELLDVDGLSLPEYPYFAVDICHRLNHSMAEYFALRDKCCAISFHTENYAIMNGIASRQKGYGGVALKNILAKNKGRRFLVCCREHIKGFYERYGFEELYKAGYWVKNL
ncbi:MAG: hypothetical protein IKK24_07440 [Clostridia bacterium]|nr:hypothetical protein [Clostridia bacterium]